MDPEPQQPGERAAEVQPLDLGDGAGAADRGEVALVDVAERLDRLAGEPALAPTRRRVAALLHRDGRDAGQVLDARRPADFTRTMSPSASTSGCPGSVRSGSTVTRPARSVSAPAASARRPATLAAATPAAHTTVRAPTRRVVPSGALSSTPAASMSTTSSLTSEVTPSPSSWRTALADRSGGKAASTRSPPSTSRIRPSARVHRAVVARQRVARELGDLARHLDAGRARAHHHEREPLRAPLVVGLELGRLERPQDPVAHVERALERLDLRRVLGPLRVAEVGVLRAARHDQHVVGDLDAPARPRSAAAPRRRGARGRRRRPRRAARARCARA